MRHLDGIRTLAGQYDGFIVDLWGVIHDGVTPYEGAIDAMTRLRATGKPVVLLSNAPRRASAAREGLRELGIGDDLYSALMTSGEATWAALAGRPGARVYHLGPDRDVSVFDGHDLRMVDRPRDADLLVNTGPNDAHGPSEFESYLPELAACLDAGLPMLCANPDLEVVRDGARIICAGALAVWYEKRGGRVEWIGKPYPSIYATTLDMLGVPSAQTLAIGDALRTDIAGAATARIASCWVLGGIHAHDHPGDADREAALAGLSPVAAIPKFRW